MCWSMIFFARPEQKSVPDGHSRYCARYQYATPRIFRIKIIFSPPSPQPQKEDGVISPSFLSSDGHSVITATSFCSYMTADVERWTVFYKERR